MVMMRKPLYLHSPSALLSKTFQVWLVRNITSPLRDQCRSASLSPNYIVFLGEEAGDLPFKRGEELTIIEPCSVIYWYIAANNMGRRGAIPITYVQVNSHCK